tara:strand:+ start:724 stop:894 length:171 start_codon:yes stop_codon:yes gene_type:complete
MKLKTGKVFDVYSMLDGHTVDRLAEDIAEALAKNGYDVSAIEWDITCNVLSPTEDL